MNVLHIDSGILGDHSVSRRLSAAVVAQIKAEQPDATITYRDVVANPLSHLSGAHLMAANAKPEDIDALVHELSTPKYGFNSAGKVKVENKDGLRKADRLGHSPDLADAACLTLAEGVLVENSYEGSASRVVVPSADAWVW